MNFGKENDNIRWSVFLIALTTIFIIPAVGMQAKDIHDGVTFGMPVTAIMNNYLFLFVVFPICYFIFIRHTRKFENRFIKGTLFLIQGIGIFIYAFCFVDNSHPGVNMNTEAGLSYYASDTAMFVLIIPLVDILISILYFISGKRKRTDSNG